MATKEQFQTQQLIAELEMSARLQFEQAKKCSEFLENAINKGDTKESEIWQMAMTYALANAAQATREARQVREGKPRDGIIDTMTRSPAEDPKTGCLGLLTSWIQELLAR